MFLLKIPRCSRSYRKYSTKINTDFSASTIRQTFLNYFINKHDHRFIRSSPVTPFCDSTVPFVNAGMNQFKNIFLGKSVAPCERACNSQKCIRISGKHNDLDIIGTDGYHHTFFEMLGNWSFGDYYKERACNLAWSLLTKHYAIDPNRLYVTYFGGDSQLKIGPDYECRDIWRSIGVPNDHILPFGVKENFWEMGLSGPCGPSTEIHIDHLPNSESKQRAHLVNAGMPDLTELWNIVFIEYNRTPDGIIHPLHDKYVDTGMGFERLVAVMQGKSSNYDTDLFTPIFDAISKDSKMTPYSGTFDKTNSNYELDYAYRVVADHTRMCSVCIADGLYPQTSYRLRKIVRRTLNICENIFKRENLMSNIVLPEIVNILGTVYPELQKNCTNIQAIFDYEAEFYKSAKIRNRKEFQSLNISSNGNIFEDDVIDFAGFPTGYRDVEKLLQTKKTINSLPIDFIYDKLHIKSGLSEEIIEKIAIEKNLTVNMNEFTQYKKQKQYEAKTNRQHVNASILTPIDPIEIPITDYSFMYNYTFDTIKNEYEIENITAKVKLIKSSENHHHIVLDRTNFYHTAGGQDADIGYIIDSNGIIFKVDAVEMHHGHVLHIGHFENNVENPMYELNQDVQLHVNGSHRTALSQHHTAMHLLQAAIKHVTGQITFQQSSHVTCADVKCELGAIGKRIDTNQITQIEDLIRNIIGANVPIETHLLAAHDLYALDNVTLIPGAIYPDENIRVVMMTHEPINFKSIEPCCGTHARNSSDLIDFCITEFKFNANIRSYNISAIAGNTASDVQQNNGIILEKFQNFKNQMKNENSLNHWKLMEVKMRELLSEMEQMQIPFTTKANILAEMDELRKTIKHSHRANLRELIVTEMTNVLSKRIENNDAFVIHILNTTEALEGSLITDAEQICHDLPMILLNVSDNKIMHGRALIPLKYTTNHFNAKHWMEELGKSLNIKCTSNKKKKQFAVCSFRDIPFKQYSIGDLQTALENAKIAAQNAFTKLVMDDQNNCNREVENLLEQMNIVKMKLQNNNSIAKMIELELESRNIRNHIKNNLFVYTIKKKCLTELAELDEKIFEIRTTAEMDLVSNKINDATLVNQPYIVTAIETEHMLGNRTMMHATDLGKDIPMVLINISNEDVVGRISIPSQFTTENFHPKYLLEQIIKTFDGECIHLGTRYDTSVCDFRLNKQLVNDRDMKNVFEKVKSEIENVLGK